MIRLRYFIITLVFASLGFQAKAQQLAVHTNMLYDALAMPSLGVELVTSKRTSLDLNFAGAYGTYYVDMKMLQFTPEFRYWVSNRPFYSFFVGATGIACIYDITGKKKSYKGTIGGAGITFGYSLKVSERLAILFHAGCSLQYYGQKEYYNGDNYDNLYSINGETRSNSHGLMVLPTNVGVTLNYLIK